MHRAGVSPRAGATAGRDWTSGSIWRNLLSLSWPMIVSSSLNMLGPTIDTIWMGKLGESAIAGVGIAGVAVQVVNSLISGIFVGLQAMVARFVGGGEKDKAVHAAQQALVIGVGFSLVIAVIGMALTEPILRLLGLSAEVVEQGAPYMRIQFVGMITMTFLWMSNRTMTASGDTIMPMWISVFYRLLHVFICPFMIFGWWLFPRMGASGAAITNVITQGLGAILGMWFLFSGRTRLKLTMKNFRLDPDVIWRIVKIGVPAGISNMERSFGQMVFMWLVAGYGTMAIAAHTVGQRVDNFLQMPATAVGQAAGVLTAQNLGARQPERAARSAWLAVAAYTAVMVLASLAVWFWAENIAGIFTPSHELRDLTGVFLRIQIVNLLAFGFLIVLMQCLNSVGDTLPVMITIMVTMWGVQLPLAYFLPRLTNSGIAGVWWALAIGSLLRGGFYGVYFKMGRWKRKIV